MADEHKPATTDRVESRVDPAASQVDPAASQVDPVPSQLETAITEEPGPTVTTRTDPSSPPAATLPVRQPLWARIFAEPARTPEHVVREAVRRLGPDARAWVERAKGRYPQAPPSGLTRLATIEYAKLARRHAVASGPAGALGSLRAAAILAQTQTRLILTIAAAYGVDPTSEDRVPELLDLLRLSRVIEPRLDAARNVATLLGAYAVCRAAARMLPFGAAIAQAVRAQRGIEDVAARAVLRYRPPSAGAPYAS